MKLAILGLNILGTFFLSVEAIKVENLERLVNFLNKSKISLNPKIEWVETTEKEKTNSSSRFLLKILIIFYPISFISTFFFLEKFINFYWIIGISVFVAFVYWTFLIYLLKLTIQLLRLIEKHTSRGLIGISGFIILVTSFIFQYYSA